MDIWGRRRTFRPVSTSTATSSPLLSYISFRTPPSSLVRAQIYPPTDPRRKVASSFIRMYNTMGDPAAWRRHLRRHITADCQWENRYVGRHNPYGPMYAQLDGIDAICKYYDTAARLSPDMVNHMQASDVLLRSDGRAIVILQSFVFGTKVFQSQTEGHQQVVVSREGEAVAINPIGSTAMTSDSSLSETASTHAAETTATSSSIGTTEVDRCLYEEEYEDESSISRDMEDILSGQLQNIDLTQRVLMPGEKQMVVAALNLGIGYSLPMYPEGHERWSDRGKLYKVVNLHTGALEMH